MKTKINTLLALVVMTAASLLSGCASNGERPPVTKDDIITALEITAALTIGDDYRKAQTALSIVEDARRYVQQGEQLTAGNAIEYIVAKVLEGSSLDAGQRIAIQRFAARYRHNFAIETGDVGLSPDIVITVSQALDSIELVAQEILRDGVAAPRSYALSAAPASGINSETVGLLGFTDNGKSGWRNFIDYQFPPGQVDLSLISGYLLSAETRQWCANYYNPAKVEPGQLERVQKLEAIMFATNPKTGEVDHEAYLDYTQPLTP